MSLDPDYRKKGWNESRFAPKNRGRRGNISRLSAFYATILIVMIYAIPYVSPKYRSFMWSMQGIFAGFIIWFIFYVLIGITIRKREWRRIQSVMAKREATMPMGMPTTISRQVRVKPLHDLSPSEFEREIAWLFNVITPTKAIPVGGAGDGGVDIELHKDGRLVGIVQCKKYDPNRILQPDHIRAFYATKVQVGVKRAYLVTTARISKQSLNEAEKLGIKIMAGNELNQHYEKAKTTLNVLQ